MTRRRWTATGMVVENDDSEDRVPGRAPAAPLPAHICDSVFVSVRWQRRWQRRWPPAAHDHPPSCSSFFICVPRASGSRTLRHGWWSLKVSMAGDRARTGLQAAEESASMQDGGRQGRKDGGGKRMNGKRSVECTVCTGTVLPPCPCPQTRVLVASVCAHPTIGNTTPGISVPRARRTTADTDSSILGEAPMLSTEDADEKSRERKFTPRQHEDGATPCAPQGAHGKNVTKMNVIRSLGGEGRETAASAFGYKATVTRADGDAQCEIKMTETGVDGRARRAESRVASRRVGVR